jgi:hypothetical protein
MGDRYTYTSDMNYDCIPGSSPGWLGPEAIMQLRVTAMSQTFSALFYIHGGTNSRNHG